MQKPVNNNILFLTLRIFSATGGIEKVCKVAGKALHELFNNTPSDKIKIFSLYDSPSDIDDKYFPSSIFKGFGKSRFKFLHQSVAAGYKSRIIVLSHINLLLVGYLIKLLVPETRLILMAHGIEVWKPLPKWKKIMLHKFDEILTVSDFTKQQMIQLYHLPVDRFIILNNCLDPFLPAPLHAPKSADLLAKYGIEINDCVLFSLCRLSFTEKYKGYDQVIKTVYELKQRCPTLKYLLVGKYDEPEKERLQKTIVSLSLQNNIILAGFIPDEQFAAHFNLADIYIMPSQKEGFGIVFIEALFYGKPVIAGNMDGSVDALKNGIFGLLVNPLNEQQIASSIIEVFNNKEKYVPKHEEVLKYFSYETYKEKLNKIILNL